MKAILKKVNGVYHKGSEQGMALVKTAFYYGFIPTVLLLGLKSMDLKAIVNSFKGVDAGSII